MRVFVVIIAMRTMNTKEKKKSNFYMSINFNVSLSIILIKMKWALYVILIWYKGKTIMHHWHNSINLYHWN